MEVDKLLHHTQYALPVGFVLILAALVFVFGFKSVAEPKFSDRSSEEKKAKKQAKPKENKVMWILRSYLASCLIGSLIDSLRKFRAMGKPTLSQSLFGKKGAVMMKRLEAIHQPK